MLAGTALAPAGAQIADLGGATQTTTNFLNFVPPGLGILPAEITNGALRADISVNQTFAGNLTDSGGVLGLRKQGTGTLTLSGVNTHSGATSVTAGTLVAGSATALSPNSLLAVNGPVGTPAIVDLNGFSNTVGGLSGGSRAIITSTGGAAVLTVVQNTNDTYSGALQGNLGLVKSGTGLLVISNDDPALAATTMTGPVTLQQGRLSIGSDNALGSGVITVTGVSELGVSAGARVLDNNIVLNNALTLVVGNGRELDLNGVISGSGSLITNSVGTQRLTGANSYSGGTVLDGNGRLEIGSATALGTGAITAGSTRLALADPTASLTIANNIILADQPLRVETGAPGSVFGLAGNISGSNAVLIETSSGGGTLLLTGNNSGHTGRIQVGSQGILAIGNSTAVGSGATVSFAPGGRLTVTDDVTIAGALSALTGSGLVSGVLDTAGFDVAITGRVHDRDGIDLLQLVKTGAGILTLANPETDPAVGNHMSGGAVVDEGTLNLTGALAGDISIAGGATLAGTGWQTSGVTQLASGAILAPGDALAGAGAIGTLTLNQLTLNAGAISNFDLAAPGTGDRVVVNGPLALGGTLNVNALSGFGTGSYVLFAHAGALSGSLTLGTVPAGYLYGITSVGRGVRLEVSLTDFYWDGAGPAGNGVVNGGSGIWSAAGTNWTNQTGVGVEDFQPGENAFFTNTGGTITLADSTSYRELNFQANGYVINPAAAQTLSATGGMISVTAGNTATINAALAGTGGLSKTGPGILVLGGANTVTGGFTINGGTLAVTSAAALGPDAVFINGGAQTLRFDASMTVANTINATGVGYNIDTGANTVILNGSLSGGGADKFGSGTLVLNNAINAQPNALAVFGGTLIVNGGVQGGVGGASASTIGGTGTVTGLVSTSGTLSPGAAPGQVGTLTVGSLTLGSTSTSLFDLGAPAGPNDLVVSNGNLVLDGTLNVNPLAGWNTGTGSYTLFTYGGALTDNGLALGGALTTAPTGVSYAIDTGTAGVVLLDVSYAGNFNWDGAGPAANGVVNGGSGTWNDSSTNWTNDPGTFNLAYVDDIATVANFGGVSGGTVTLDGDRTAGTVNFTTGGYTLTGDSLNLAGDATISVAAAITAVIESEIAGVDGLTKTGGGILALNGANSYTGGTALSAGTIRVANDNALSSGALAMAGGTTLAAGAADLVLANAIGITGISTIDSGGNRFALDGVVSGGGTLSKQGSGTLVLNGNSYTGGTALQAGTIEIRRDSSLGTGALAMAGGTTLRAIASDLILNNAISTAGVGTIDSGPLSLTLDGLISGPGSIAKVGAGTLVLSNANSYAGGTALNTGTILIGNSSALGTGALAMAGGTTLVAGAPNLLVLNAVSTAGVGTINTGTSTLTLAGIVSGAGSIAKVGTGTLVLNGANSYAGGTTLAAGGITVGTSTALGSGALAMAGGTRLTAGADGLGLANAISTAGIGTVDTGANTLALSGIVSGSGSIAKVGSGTLVLNGANTYAGGTALDAGAITVGSNSALGTGALTAADGTRLNNGGSAVTLANAIALAGPAFTIDSGAAPAVLTLAGVISGNSSLTKTGSGILTLAGASTYAGPTTVTAGTLNVTGSLVSAVNVNSGAGITGTGSVAALTVAAGGAINPGAPGTSNIATLTANGPASLLGTYTVNFAGATSDRVTATGDLVVGGTFAVGSVTAPPLVNTVYTLASGATRTGTFGTVNGLSLFGPAFIPELEYTATTVNLRLRPGLLEPTAILFGGATGNALEAARAIDRAVLLGYNPQAFAALYNAGTALPRALLEISGEQRATERRVMMDSARVYRETALDRLNSGLASMAGQLVTTGDEDIGAVTFWLRGAGAWGTADTSGAATAFTTEQRGLLTGMDWSRDGLTVGAMFHYTSTDIDFTVLGGSSNVETTGGTFYAGWRNQGSGLVANAGVSVAGTRSTGARAVTLPGLVQSLQGRTIGTTLQGFGELAFDVAGSADARIEPFARYTYVQNAQQAMTERNGVAALSAAKQTLDLQITNLGLRVGTGMTEGKVSISGSASWQRTTGARDARTIIGIPAVGQNGQIRSVALDRNAALLQADIGFNLSDRARINVGYSGLVGQNNSDHAGRATLSFAF
ncbi:autotransporter-associated beta strand repeat-containing protein [Sandarakinorhabdus rubra]|uniref:autotransporter-associated beta strand repeat-containing protein n=1 Tax=Sandarakinorhabdus rubra TaxID=2672568 RepID=UPI0013DC7ECF|nr:autotransporter-associated beta strand repeat-containing protein [Sandarakinorhabdus rubra]